MGARLWDHCVRAHRSFRTAPTEAPCTPPTRDVQTQGDYEEDAWCHARDTARVHRIPAFPGT